MKILGIAVMKNEADIVRSFLDHSSQWADRIFVYDNGSTDGTWEIVQSMASHKIVPWKSEDIPFHNNLRARVFNEFRHEAEEGDWWCYRMDVDEFYIDNPREFLATVPAHYHTVYRKCINYLVTREDIDEYEFTGDFEQDRHLLRYFRPNGIVERRFIKHRDGLKWNEHSGTVYTGITYPKMIFAKHYRWRSPQQIQRRLDSKRDYVVRKANTKGRDARAKEYQQKYVADRWMDQCPPRSQMVFDSGPDSWATVSYKEHHIKRITESPISYAVKRILHALRILR